MHTEVQVALKFVISFLYNKLPRRRVNLFGEELDHALKDKFQGHWYPDKPFKGSAYRCLKITDPADPVLNRAARESGNPMSDIIENLPADLAVWIDPGEVSYRIGEKGSVKILYSEKDSSLNLEDINPDVRGFLSLDTVTASLNGLSLSQQSSYGGSSSPLSAPISPPIMTANTSPPAVNYPPNPFQPRQQPVVYTAASFAQTKFGSTKLKTNSKKPNRMSPTEFSNYIKQRALQKSIQQQQQQQHYSGSQSPGPHSQFQDKFYGQNGYYYGNNPGNSNFNFNNFPKSGSNGLNSNDLGFMMGGSNQNQLSPTPSSAGNQNHLSPSPGPGLNLSDYSNLFTDWDNETEANAFLADILSSAAGEVARPAANRQLSTGFEDWLSTASNPLGFNANQESTGLGPESRSSSTKSMSSVADGPAAAPPPAANSDGGFNQRVLVAN